MNEEKIYIKKCLICGGEEEWINGKRLNYTCPCGNLKKQRLK